MSVLTKVLAEEVRKIEETKFAEADIFPHRLTHHLMPPAGWLNDPNGLCYYKGRYHVFFQYSPFEVKGGLKFWGHYSSEDLVSWIYEGVSLYPDGPMDCHGTLEHRDGILTLTMDEEAGAGRRNRNACVEQVKDIRILADTSAVEIYVNQGEVVFSSRFYGKTRAHMLKVEAEKFRGGLWKLEKMKVAKA